MLTRFYKLCEYEEMELGEIQKQVFKNKINKGFDVTNVEREFCLLYGELGEAFEAYLKKKEGLGGELADVAIYLFGLSEMLGFDLQQEIERKMEINERREYEIRDGVPQKKKK